MPLGCLDYIIMGLYMAGLIGLGLYYRRFAQQGLDTYFLGGRTFKGWMTGTSYAVTCMNADVPVVYCGRAVVTGVWVCWWYIARFGLALMIAAVLFAVFWRRLKIFTSPEFYELRFSGTTAVTMRTWISLRSASIAVVAWTGCGLLGLCKVADQVLGWSHGVTMAAVIPVILTYVILSGYVGVVVSDLFQALILIASSLVLMALVWADFGGPAGLHDQLVATFGERVVSWHPPSSHEFLGVMGVLGWIMGTAVGYGGDLAPMAGAMEGQRVLSCRNGREASKMYVWTAVMLFLMLAVLTLPSLGAMVKWPGLYTGAMDQELAYPKLLIEYLPSGVLGLALIGLFASIMSTVDSNMNLGAQVFINDIYRRLLRPDASPAHYLRVGKVVMLGIMGLAVIVAVKADKLIDVSVFMLGLSSAELSANWGQWWWWRFNGRARLAASFGGPVIFLVMRYAIYPALDVPHYLKPENLPAWLAPQADRFTAEAITEKVTNSYMYLPILGAIALTCVLWILVALFTKPDPEEKLIAFYRRVKPPGWWGPIARKAGAEPTGARSVAAGLGIAVLGAVLVASGTIAFSALYVARLGVAAAGAAAAVGAGLLFRATYARFMRRVQTGQDEAQG